MSTLRVDKIAPFQSSSVEIDGAITLPTMATTGSNTFVGNQIVTGSIDITGEFLVNGTPITGSGGGSIETGSFATTGSNTFTGNQTVNGNSVQNISAPDSESQTDFVSVSGVEIDGKPYDYTNFGINNYPSFGDVYKNAFAFESYFNDTTFDYGAELKLSGKGLDAVVFISGSVNSGRIALLDLYNGNAEARLQADSVIIGKPSGSTNVEGSFVVNTIDTLPAGIPGQIAFQDGKMHVYISGQWNQVAFVSSPPPPPPVEQFFSEYDASSAAAACTSETINEVWTDTGWFVGGFLWTDEEKTTPAADGFYKFGDNAYELASGEMVSETACE